MPDREKKPDENTSSSSTPQRGDERHVPPDPDVGKENDPASQKSSASRPRGHTEEPDRTL